MDDKQLVKYINVTHLGELGDALLQTFNDLCNGKISAREAEIRRKIAVAAMLAYKLHGDIETPDCIDVESTEIECNEPIE